MLLEVQSDRLVYKRLVFDSQVVASVFETLFRTRSDPRRKRNPRLEFRRWDALVTLSRRRLSPALPVCESLARSRISQIFVPLRCASLLPCPVHLGLGAVCLCRWKMNGQLWVLSGKCYCSGSLRVLEIEMERGRARLGYGCLWAWSGPVINSWTSICRRGAQAAATELP